MTQTQEQTLNELLNLVTDAYWQTAAARALFRLTADTAAEDLNGEDAGAFKSAGLVLAEALSKLHDVAKEVAP
jgi:hypothetical protein